MVLLTLYHGTLPELLRGPRGGRIPTFSGPRLVFDFHGFTLCLKATVLSALQVFRILNLL